jgi:hypothetical protein
MNEGPSPQPFRPLSPRFRNALLHALLLHRDQRRKGGATPYFAHLMAVAALVLEDGGDEDEAIAALLHDALEDHPERVSAEEVAARYGERVARLMVECSDTPDDFAGGAKPPWLPRKQRFLAHLRGGPESLRVSLADKLHNARSIRDDRLRIGDAVWERFSVPREATLWYYAALVDAFREGGAGGPMLHALERVVRELHAPSATLPGSGSAVADPVEEPADAERDEEQGQGEEDEPVTESHVEADDHGADGGDDAPEGERTGQHGRTS